MPFRVNHKTKTFALLVVTLVVVFIVDIFTGNAPIPYEMDGMLFSVLRKCHCRRNRFQLSPS